MSEGAYSGSGVRLPAGGFGSLCRFRRLNGFEKQFHGVECTLDVALFEHTLMSVPVSNIPQLMKKVTLSGRECVCTEAGAACQLRFGLAPEHPGSRRRCGMPESQRD